MPDANDEVIDRLYEGVWNGTDPELADQLVHEEYRIHDRELATQLQGPALYRALADRTREIFPDMSFNIEDIVADGDTVALRWTMSGTHEGPLFGIDPTGTQVTLSAIEFNRFEDGQLVETWTQSDQLGLMEQIGAAPVDQ